MGRTVIFLFTEGSQIPIGTGFIVGYPVPGRQDMVVPMVVTAKHVVGGHQKILGRFTPKEGTIPIVVMYDLAGMRREGDLWEHPDEGVDIVAFRTAHFEQTEYVPIPLQMLASVGTYKDEDIKPTDRVIFPCMLVNFMGSGRNYPVIRDGSIALIPDEPVPLRYTVGSKQVVTKQHVVLIDATSIPGASGSPVFLWPGPRLRGNAFNVGGTQPWLLGIMHGFFPALPRELIEIEQSVEKGFAENSGIALIFPSWSLLEILQQEKVTERVKQLSGKLS